jgi:hypothetical protein
VDAVAGRSGIAMCELFAAVALLELTDYVVRDVGGAFVRNPTLVRPAGAAW